MSQLDGTMLATDTRICVLIVATFIFQECQL